MTTAPLTLPLRTAQSDALVPRTAAYRSTMLVVAGGGLANFALLYYVQPLLPQLAKGFGVADGQSGLALSVSTLAMLAGLVLVGSVAERMGRVRTMAASLVLAGVFSSLSVFAPTWTVFLATRALAGVALAGFPSIALASLRERVHETAHARANASYIAATALGGAAARVLPGPLSALGGWQLSTWLFGGFSVVMGILVVLLLRRDARPASTAHLSTTLAETFRALTDRKVLLLCLIGGVNMAAFVGVYNAVSFRLEAAPFALGTAEALVYLAYPVGILAPAVFRRWSARTSRSVGVAIGAAFIAAAVIVLLPNSLPTVLIGLGILTFGFLGTHGVLSGWVVDSAHRAGRSTTGASSAYLLIYYFGSTVAGTASTQVWAATGWWGVTTMALALAVASAVLLAVLARSLRRG